MPRQPFLPSVVPFVLSSTRSFVCQLYRISCSDNRACQPPTQPKGRPEYATADHFPVLEPLFMPANTKLRHLRHTATGARSQTSIQYNSRVVSLETRRIDALAQSRPLWQFCKVSISSQHISSQPLLPFLVQHTVYSLPVLLLLPVKNGIFILWHHLFFPWHLGVPSLNCLCAHSLVLQCSTESIDHLVNQLQPLPLPCLLGCAESPWTFPGEYTSVSGSHIDSKCSIP